MTFFYTVVCEAESDALADALEAWLRDAHLRAVCEAGALEAEIVRRSEGSSVEVRYLFASPESFARYERDHAPRLRAEGLARFPSGIRFSRWTGRGGGRFAVEGLRVEIVPYFRDNYAYLVHEHRFGNRGERPCVVVDPGDADAVLEACALHGLRPTALLCTHHHPDHIGGVDALVDALGPLPVYGSAHDLRERRIPEQTAGLADGERIDVLGRAFTALAVPGHTLGAVSYVGEGMAFTGDTLFLGGCGRVFEGTMSMMHASLSRLRELEPSTHLYVGHEYTEANLVFAATVEPDNDAIRARLEAVRARRARGEPTMPGTIGQERETNPFLRCDVDAVIRFAERLGPVERAEDVFARVREAKDRA